MAAGTFHTSFRWSVLFFTVMKSINLLISLWWEASLYIQGFIFSDLVVSFSFTLFSITHLWYLFLQLFIPNIFPLLFPQTLCCILNFLFSKCMKHIKHMSTKSISHVDSFLLLEYIQCVKLELFLNSFNQWLSKHSPDNL